MNDFPETDWQNLRALHPVALERYCARVLGEIEQLRVSPTKNSHVRYLAIWQLLKRRDRELADAFNDMRRSRALERICAIRDLGLFSDEEFARFSAETRDEVSRILK